MKNKLLLATALSMACGTPDNMVDETGYLTGERIYYTSAAALADEDREVSVIGTPGALLKDAGTLTLVNVRSGESAPTLVQTGERGFFAKINAKKQDTLRIRLEDQAGGQSVELPLSDALDQLESPGLCPTCVGVLVQDLGNDQVQVNLSLLRSQEPPLLIHNERSGDSVFVQVETSSVTLGGRAGDEVCISDQSPQSASPTYCEPAR